MGHARLATSATVAAITARISQVAAEKLVVAIRAHGQGVVAKEMPVTPAEAEVTSYFY